MARKRSKSTRSGSDKSNFGGDYRFVNVRLSADDKARLAETDLAIEFPLATILDLVAEGYKFSLKEDTKNGTFVASFTDTREGAPTYRAILTGRGSTSLNAWYALAYRHFVMLPDGWQVELSDTGVSDFD